MKDKLPEHFKRFVEKYPEIWESHQGLTEACADSGPLDRKMRELIKVAVSGAFNQEVAVERHAVMAVQEGASVEEVYHAILMLITSVGFPRASAALKWAQRALET